MDAKEDDSIAAKLKRRAQSRLASLGLTSSDEKQAEGTTTNAAPDTEAKEAKEEDDSEKSAVKLSKKARKKYIERGITGSITISRTIGISTVDVVVEVTEDDLTSGIPAGDDTASEAGDDEYSGFERKCVGAMDSMLDSLAKRAYRGWRNVDFNDNVTLSKTITIGFVTPLLKLGLEMSITFSCAVPTLIASAEAAGLK